MHLKTNPQLELAYEYICYTNRSVFLTGKAGTGKTTFLHRIKGEGVKRMVVVAPTGVAAINAGGMTIHSFFQLPFGPYLPGNAREAARQRKFSGEKIRLIRSLDLLIIDEISMVRADLLDGIDEVLRRYKDQNKPFGGVQLLMIGDLHQLPPVAREEEWALLRDLYETPYFFSSRALQKAGPVVIELKHIFRQSDEAFIDLLNKVRHNQLDANVLDTLNSRFIPDFRPADEEGYITLTTHNATAHNINAEKLSALPAQVKKFRASIDGDFPEHAYPTEEILELKTGAQVMFVKNDLAPEKRFYNGRIGKVTGIGEEGIYVRCPGDAEDIYVEKVDWRNVRYSLNEETREVAEEIIGTFTQYPLRLAWAITIHKSQGLTFGRVILDAQAAFAHGQVYVALSRCKSFEGLVLRSRIHYSSVRTDTTIRHFTEAAEKNAPDQAQLEQSKIAYQQSLVLELFDFDALRKNMDRLKRVLLEHENALNPGAIQQFQAFTLEAETEVLPVGDKFRIQLRNLFGQGTLPEADETLQERIRKGSTWFADKLAGTLLPAAGNIRIITDNKSVRKSAKEALENVQKELFIKNACLTAAQEGFSSQGYLHARINADLDFQVSQHSPVPVAEAAPGPRETPHPELYALLEKWRRETAATQNVAPYEVLPAQSLLQLVRDLPADQAALKKIKGVGKGRIRKYGAGILAIIEDFRIANQLLAIEPAPPPKQDSKALSFELFRAGRTIAEIAVERGFVPSTIEGHLAHFISLGQLDVSELVDPADVEKIEAYLCANPDFPISAVRAHFEEAYSYGQIKMVQAHMKKDQKEKV